MAVADARMEFRLRPDLKLRIERAAKLVDQPVSEFARSAAQERAESVLHEHEAVTVVPAEFFDELFDALDATPARSAELAEAAREAERIVTRR